MEIEDSGTVSMGKGMLNARRFPPGAILQLPMVNDDREKMEVTMPYVLRVGSREFMPVKQQNLFVKATGRFALQTDAETLREARRVRMDLGRSIENNTMAMLSVNSLRWTLQDPVALVNKDPRAVRLIQAESVGHRFAIVTAVTYGDPAVTLLYTETALGLINVMRVGRIILHVEYRCPEAVSINTAGASLGKSTPIVFFYIQLKYNCNSGKVEIERTVTTFCARRRLPVRWSF
jgi:hypothetical protein